MPDLQIAYFESPLPPLPPLPELEPELGVEDDAELEESELDDDDDDDDDDDSDDEAGEDDVASVERSPFAFPPRP